MMALLHANTSPPHTPMSSDKSCWTVDSFIFFYLTPVNRPANENPDVGPKGGADAGGDFHDIAETEIEVRWLKLLAKLSAGQAFCSH
jgi:hypothetical protein